MTKTRWVVVALLAVAPVSAWSESDGEGVAGQLAELNRNLARVSGTLEALLANQRVEVLIRRIELAERRLEPLAGRVDDERSWVSGLEREIGELEAMKVSFEEARERAVREGRIPDESDEDAIRHISVELGQRSLELDKHRALELEASQDLERERRRVTILDERLEEILDE